MNKIELIEVPTLVKTLNNEKEVNVSINFIEKKDNDKIWLNIPYHQKELAKELAQYLSDGRRAINFDKHEKKWYAEKGADLTKLTPWLITPPKENKILATEKTWLSIPYEHLEAVKQLAGKLPDGDNTLGWDKEQKCWFAKVGANLEILQPWVDAYQNEKHLTSSLSPEEEFREVLLRVGCLITTHDPIMDGKPHRIALDTDKKGEKSGFYVGFMDGHPAGYVKNNRSGEEIKWKSKGFIMPEMDRSLLHTQLILKQKLRMEELQIMQEEGALLAQKILAALQNFTKVPLYCERKGISPSADIFTDNNQEKIYIPIMDIEGKIWSTQIITSDGSKWLRKNCKKEGCFHVIGGLDALKNVANIIIAEGYATAYSISKALKTPVVVAFDAGNMEAVALVLKKAYPEKKFLIAGDDDKQLEIKKNINPGKTFALMAADKVGGEAIFPIFAPGEQEKLKLTDFNDLAMKSTLGYEAIERQFKPFLKETIRTQQVVTDKCLKKHLTL